MKELLQEWKNHLDEEIYGNRAIVYHGTNSLKDVESILTQGYSLQKNTSAMYGKGIYTVYELAGSSTGKGGYGSLIVKFAVDMSGKHLILDYDQAKKVHGDDYRFEDQLRKFGLLDDLENTTRQDKTVVGPGTVIEKDRKNKTIIIKVIDIGIINQDEIPQSDKITNYINQKRKRELSPIALENIWVHYQMTDGFGRSIFNNSETTQFIAGYNDFYYNFVSPKDTKLIKDEPITLEKVPYKNTKSLNDAKRLVDYIYDEEGNLKYDNAYTSDIAKKVHNILSSKDNKITEIDSITFTGRNDGPVMVIYNPEKTTMLAWKKLDYSMTKETSKYAGYKVNLKDNIKKNIMQSFINYINKFVEYKTAWMTDDYEKLQKETQAIEDKFYDETGVILAAIMMGLNKEIDSLDYHSITSWENKSAEELKTIKKEAIKKFTNIINNIDGRIEQSRNDKFYIDWAEYKGRSFLRGVLPKDFVDIVEGSRKSDWVKDVNGKKILDYIEKKKKDGVRLP